MAEAIVLLVIFPKSGQPNLTAAEKAQLKKVIQVRPNPATHERTRQEQSNEDARKKLKKPAKRNQATVDLLEGLAEMEGYVKRG